VHRVTARECRANPPRSASRAGTRDAAGEDMMITQKKINRVLQGMVAAMPAIPYIMKSRRRTSITAYVLGGVGFAIAGGLAAVMFFSPRTRTRALNVAKDTYGKVNEKIGHLRHTGSEALPMSNGLVDRGEYSTTTGL
jgi:hypothetical protein